MNISDDELLDLRLESLRISVEVLKYSTKNTVDAQDIIEMAKKFHDYLIFVENNPNEDFKGLTIKQAVIKAVKIIKGECSLAQIHKKLIEGGIKTKSNPQSFRNSIRYKTYEACAEGYLSKGRDRGHFKVNDANNI